MEGLWTILWRRSIDLQSDACMPLLMSNKGNDIAHEGSEHCPVIYQRWKYLDESQLLEHQGIGTLQPYCAMMYLQEKVERLSALIAGQLLWGGQMLGVQPGLLQHKRDTQHDS